MGIYVDRSVGGGGAWNGGNRQALGVVGVSKRRVSRGGYRLVSRSFGCLLCCFVLGGRGGLPLM
jgi:hypothetical protein